MNINISGSKMEFADNAERRLFEILFQRTLSMHCDFIIIIIKRMKCSVRSIFHHMTFSQYFNKCTKANNEKERVEVDRVFSMVLCFYSGYKRKNVEKKNYAEKCS